MGPLKDACLQWTPTQHCREEQALVPASLPLPHRAVNINMHARADSSGELLLVFTQIAAQDPKREFVLGVRVPDSNIFEGEQAADMTSRSCPVLVFCSFAP